MKVHEILPETEDIDQETVDVDGVQRSIYNSEGRLVAPTSDQQVAFWRWFGKSKTIDQSGRPLVLFRGGQPGKSVFTGRENSTNYIQGNIFFTNDRYIAKGYTPHRTNSYIASSEMDQSHGLYSVYLRMVKPVILDAKDADWSRVPLSGPLKKAIGWDAMQIDDIAMHVQQKTQSDGLIVKNVFDQFGLGDQFVVFSGQQIRLA